MALKDPFDLPKDPNVEGNKLVTGYNKTEPTFLDEYEDYVKSYIMTKLGHPVVRVELTDSQYKVIISETIDEISPWVVMPSYLTIPHRQRVDVTEYNIEYIINVEPASSSNADKAFDVFNNTYSSVMYARSGMDYGNRSYFESLVNHNLEMQLMGQMRSNMDHHPKWDFHRDIFNRKQYLLVDLGFESSSSVTVTYSPRVELQYLLEDDNYRIFTLRFALAFAREILGSIRGKYQVDGSPVTLDGESQDSKSNEELNRLREELRNTVESQFIID